MNTIERFYNEDCIEGCVRYIEDNCVDLIITDPPYGIDAHSIQELYKRKEKYILDGYVETDIRDYEDFSKRWIQQAARILRPGGSIYIFSGYTNLAHILNALRTTSLKEVNHIVWKYTFGVFTKKKYISSHYHILYYVKPKGTVTYNTYCRYGSGERDIAGGSLNYQDREDVWIINREYKPGKTKNKTELPAEVLSKLIQYSSNEGDVVCDLFLGSFSTAKVAIGLNRLALGFELNPVAFDHQISVVQKVKPGHLIDTLRKPVLSELTNQGKRWTHEEKKRLANRYEELFLICKTQKNTIEELGKEFGRGRFAIKNVLEQLGKIGHSRK